MRVVIADDSALWREGLSRLLVESGIETAALVGDADALAEAVQIEQPDVAVIDIRMPPTWTHEGAEAAVELRERHPELGLLLLSQSLETRYAAALIQAHPRGIGYLLKDRVLDVPTLVNALETVRSGGTTLDPEVVQTLLSRHDARDRTASLSDREREVLALVAEGRSNSAIARHLFLTMKTVETHITNVFAKLGLSQEADDNRRVLAVLAYINR